MNILNVRNVCEALPQGIGLLLSEGVKSPSRAGDVLVAPWPVATVYSNPRERVLFSPIRDANPAFHLAEALHMLAGRNDAAFLNLFIKDFGGRFAEPDGTIHGAYGYRWRKAFGFDQLKRIVRRLIENPNDRQCVLQMWESTPSHTSDPHGKADTLLDNEEWWQEYGQADLTGDWRDRPCNTHVYFRVRDGLLDIGVCCRSNDIIMGAYGANAVHFSILQEYMAAMIDVGVGTYTQFSFNYHMYEKDLEALKDRGGLWGKILFWHLQDDRYSTSTLEPMPLVSDPESFDEEVEALLYAVGYPKDEKPKPFYCGDRLHNRFLKNTAWPLFVAYLKRDLKFAEEVEALDWRLALTEWLQRREKK
jgi:hypothetical protein